MITESGQHRLVVYGHGRATGAYDIAVAPVRPDRVVAVTGSQDLAARRPRGP